MIKKGEVLYDTSFELDSPAAHYFLLNLCHRVLVRPTQLLYVILLIRVRITPSSLTPCTTHVQLKRLTIISRPATCAPLARVILCLLSPSRAVPLGQRYVTEFMRWFATEGAWKYLNDIGFAELSDHPSAQNRILFMRLKFTSVRLQYKFFANWHC